MASYSVTITNGSTTYTADGSATIQPSWEPEFAYEYNTDLSPAVISAVIETWTLRDLVFTSTTPSSVTGDISTLTTLLANKTTPITSVNLKYSGSTVFSLDTTNYAQVTIRGLQIPGGAGSLTNHWRGTLIVSGRKVRADSNNVVRLDMKVANSWNKEGLRTQTLTGRVEVAPGVDAATAITTTPGYALTSLGSAFVFTTGGGAADSGGGYNIDYEYENSPTNTIATFRCQQIERGLAIPQSALDYQKSVSFTDTDAGRLTVSRFTASSSSISSALTAAQAGKPSTGVVASAEQQDYDSLVATATYTARSAPTKITAFYGGTTLVYVRREVRISGGGQSREFEPIPGYDALEILAPRKPLTIRERVSVRAMNVTGPAAIPLPAPILPVELLQNDQCEESIPVREEIGESRDADLWSREATRVYMTVKPDAVDFAAMFADLLNAPRLEASPDYPTRIATKPGEGPR